MSNPYTLASWHVRPGLEAEFESAWRRLAEAFSGLPNPPLWGTLLQNEAEPTLFYSFGPWQRTEDIAAMRDDPQALAALDAVKSLCTHAAPASYRLVAHVDVAEPGDR